MLSILGPLEARHEERAIRLTKPKLEGMLAALLLEAGRVVPLRKLAEAVWDDPPATAVHQLRKLASELRRHLPDDLVSIVTDRSGYRAEVAPGQLDLAHFDERQRLAAQAESSGDHATTISELQAGLALWRGPALAGMDNLLLRSRADVLNERRVSAQARLLELRLDNGEASGLVAELSLLLAEHPLHEKLRALTMTALYRCGRQTEALQRFHEGRVLLAEEFGVDPGLELREVYERIIQADTGLHGSPHRATVRARRSEEPERIAQVASADLLPRDLNDFTGRSAELGRLLEIITRPTRDRPSVVVIDGMVGVGKTALVVHLAHRIKSLFPDGVRYVDLRGCTPDRQPLGAATALEALLGPEFATSDHDAESTSRAWQEHLAEHRALVVLDNAVDALQVSSLLPRSSDSFTIITSRAPMYELDGVAGLTLTPPGIAEAQTLLTRIVGEGRLDVNGAQAHQLADLCGGLPLAVRIVAMRLTNQPNLDVASLLDALADPYACLEHMVAGTRSVEGAIAQSYNRVPMRAQLLLHELAKIPDPAFDLKSARRVDRAAGAMLERLRDERLLIQHGLDSYSFHPLIRAYARSVGSRTAVA